MWCKLYGVPFGLNFTGEYEPASANVARLRIVRQALVDDPQSWGDCWLRNSCFLAIRPEITNASVLETLQGFRELMPEQERVSFLYWAEPLVGFVRAFIRPPQLHLAVCSKDLDEAVKALTGESGLFVDTLEAWVAEAAVDVPR